MSDSDPRPENGSNQGISIGQGNLSADVLAVGYQAQAIKNVGAEIAPEDLIIALGAFRKALHELGLSETARKSLEEDIDQVEEAAKKGKVGPNTVGAMLKSIASKLKMVGVILAQAAALAGPVGKLVAMAGTSLKELGLL